MSNVIYKEIIWYIIQKLETMYKSLDAIIKVKVTDRVTQALENIIVDNNLSPGDKLPSQAELSQKLQVGTRAIREAVRSLESRGLVETKQGKGVFVKAKNMDYFIETLINSSIFHFSNQTNLLIDLTKTRRIIESQAIYDIALNPPKGFVAHFARLLDRLDEEAERNLDAYNLLDMELHKSIIEATGNKILISLYKHLTSLLIRSFSKTGYIQGSLETSIRDHKKMLEALVSQNPVLAKQTMEQHIGLTLNKIKKMKLEH